MHRYDETWVKEHVEQTRQLWRDGARPEFQHVRQYNRTEQADREHAYDEALQAVEADARHQGALPTKMIDTFGTFAAKALDLDGEAIDLLTDEFLPVGTQLAHWARRFDSHLSIPEIIQAARNAWTACGLQPLLGMPATLTPSIFGYSLMYPYSDNYLDDDAISGEHKRRFSQRFRLRLLGQPVQPANHREQSIWRLIELVETEYSRSSYPAVFDCLLAIHQAQEQSIRQLNTNNLEGESEVLTLSCAKGGTSVLADACLARGYLETAESDFAFAWGVLLQIGDDLQDVRDDMRRGSMTLFTSTIASGKPLDESALQLFAFSDKVGRQMDEMPLGSQCVKGLLKMSWRSLITRAIADSHEYFSPAFLSEAERSSPFRFEFLRKRSERLARRHGLYESIFNRLVEVPEASAILVS